MQPRKVTLLAVDILKPYERNSRRHSDQQIDKLAASIKEFGWTNPILVDDEHGIIAGHGRVLAAKKLGLKDVPVLNLSGLSDEQKRAYIIADNQLALASDWDEDILAAELTDLKALEFDLDLLGFDNKALIGLLNRAAGTLGLTDENDVPDLPDEPVSKLGDVWVLGNHRIICGDCTDKGAVDKLLNGTKPHLMVTDPPYGVKYDASWRQKAGLSSPNAAVGVVLNDDRADWREAWALFPGSVAYIWHAGIFSGPVADSLISTKFKIRAQIVWVKQRHVLSRGDYHAQHEPCFYGVRDEDEHWHFVSEHEISTYAVKQGHVGQYVGGRKQSTVWFIEHMKSDTGHSTQKPVECMKRPIVNNSKPGDTIYEPFSGSGTTIIAGEMSGRSVLAIELNTAYVDMAVIRWQNFTGKQAILEATGKPFPLVTES